MTKFDKLTDEQLALGYIAGDVKAFDELLQRNQAKLFNYIMFVVHDDYLANDLFQETFMRAIIKMREGKYESNGKFQWWITRIAHNIIMDWYRDTNAENIADVPVEGPRVETMHTEGTREDELFHDQLMLDVRHLMENLPPTQREVVYMRYYQNIPFKEIAEMLGCSINTCLGRMRYAVMNMRKMAKHNNLSLTA